MKIHLYIIVDKLIHYFSNISLIKKYTIYYQLQFSFKDDKINDKKTSLSSNKKLNPQSQSGPSGMNKRVNSVIMRKSGRDKDGKAGPSSRKSSIGYSSKDTEVPDDFLKDDFNYEDHVIKKKPKLKDFVINNPKVTEFPDDDSLFDGLDIVEELIVEKQKPNLTKTIIIADPKKIDVNFQQKDKENYENNNEKKPNLTNIVIQDPKKKKDDKKQHSLTEFNIPHAIEFDDFDDEDFADDLFGDWNEKTEYHLNLEDFHRVRVLKIEETRSTTILTLEDPETRAKAIVTCSEAWYRLKVSIDDFVTIKAVKSKDKSNWTINNNHGFCVTQPDTLVTTTAVVNSFFCTRQGVLQSKITGLNQLPNLQAGDSALTLGTIIHELLQSALTDNIFELQDISDRFDEILKDPSTILMLYCSELKEKDIKSMAGEYISAIYEFMNRYVKNEGLKTKDNNEKIADSSDNNFKGKIIEIKDIEESVYLPSLGLKGKIDATVRVKINNTERIMPLEIKTGKSSFNQSHKGQLFTYCLMLNMLGTKVDGGLLLYIKENLMQEFKASRQEEKELILLRNTVAYYLSKLPEDNSNKNNNIKPMELPDPIHHTTACARCPYNSVCCAFAEREPELSLSQNHPLKKLSQILLQDVTENHVDYVLSWISMLEIEEGHHRDLASSRRIWATTAINREKKRQCISNLKLTAVTKEDNGTVHHFVRSESQIKFPVDNFLEVFKQYDVVSIGTDTRIHLSTGRIIKIDDTLMIIVLDKDLRKWNYTGIYHVDYYPYINRTSRLLGTVATLITDNPITKKLRRIIIDKQPATFSSYLPENFYTNEIKKICCSLNLLQDNAVKAVIQADDYVLIKALPGTGKIYFIAALVEILVLMGKTILITANSQSAVNKIMLKLAEKKIDFLRIGKSMGMDSMLLKKCDDELMRNCKTPEMLESKLAEIKVVGVTCHSAGSGLLSRKIFDYCIVDECNEILQPVIFKSLFNAEKIVLVGDPGQLSPAVQSNKARELGMGQDVFRRLDSPNNTRVLSLQYRMNLTIMNLVNQLTYHDELRAANGTISKGVYKFKEKSVIDQSGIWIKKILSDELADAVVMVNTGPTHREVLEKFIKNKKDYLGVGGNEKETGSNIFEASIVAKLVETLVKSGVEFEEIGIISPFRSQVNLLKRVVDKNGIEVDTLLKKSKSIIFLSFGKSDEPDGSGEIIINNDCEILEDGGRLNVALTRANHKIIVIGDVGSIERFTPVKKMIDCLALNKKIVELTQGVDDFSWTELITNVEKYLNY